MKDVTVSIVVAVARNGVIGRDNAMPWRLSSDQKRFRALTMGKPVIMGRKTLESLPKLLPGRPHVVISRNPAFSREGVTVVASLPAALEAARRIAAETGADEICVMGGGEIYAQALEFADVLHVTHVDAEVEGDARFPEIDPEIWEKTETLAVSAGEKDDYPTVYAVYRRHAA